MTDKNLRQKLAEIRKELEGFKKDASGYGYKYPSSEQVLGSIKDKMDELGVMLEPHLLNPTTESAGKGFLVTAEMKYIWINVDDDKDRIEIPWYMVGEQKDASQAFGSALTYSQRYFVMDYFNIPQREIDPDELKKKSDNDSSKTKTIPKIKDNGNEDLNTEFDHALLDAFPDPKTKTAKAFVEGIKNLSIEEQIEKLKERIN
jgi:hypothetical protein